MLLKHCKICGRVGFWFQFYRYFLSYWIWTPAICKQCASLIGYNAIVDECKRLEIKDND